MDDFTSFMFESGLIVGIGEDNYDLFDEINRHRVNNIFFRADDQIEDDHDRDDRDEDDHDEDEEEY